MLIRRSALVRIPFNPPFPFPSPSLLIATKLTPSLCEPGRYRCVGKNLALREISFVVALLLRSFDIEFAPGEDGSRINKDRKDLFSAMPGALDLVFRKRGEESRGDGEEIGREGGSGMG